LRKTLTNEPRNFQAAGRSYVPRHGPFRVVDELRLVLGMTGELQDTLAPIITWYSRTGDIDRQIAPDAVLGALTEMGDRLAQSQGEARSRGQDSGVDRRPVMGEALTIRARIEDDNLVMTRSAVVRLAGDRREPYWVLAWH
jgi:general secretion pathway protein K